MFNDLCTKGEIPFRYVLADSICGENPDFIDAVEQRIGVSYFVSVHSNTLCWLTTTYEKICNYRGKNKKKSTLHPDKNKPISVASIAMQIHDFFWYRRKVSEGSKGPIE